MFYGNMGGTVVNFMLIIPQETDLVFCGFLLYYLYFQQLGCQDRLCGEQGNALVKISLYYLYF